MAPTATAPVKTPATKAPVLIHTNTPAIADYKLEVMYRCPLNEIQECMVN